MTYIVIHPMTAHYVYRAPVDDVTDTPADWQVTMVTVTDWCHALNVRCRWWVGWHTRSLQLVCEKICSICCWSQYAACWTQTTCMLLNRADCSVQQHTCCLSESNTQRIDFNSSALNCTLFAAIMMITITVRAHNFAHKCKITRLPFWQAVRKWP